MFSKSIKISLILIYLFNTNAPLVYYFEYKINLDNIVKYLCEQKDEEENMCMGNCYLKKNLTKVETNEKQSEKRAIEIPGVNVAPHYINKFDFYFNQSETEPEFPKLKPNNIFSINIQPATLPPESILV